MAEVTRRTALALAAGAAIGPPSVAAAAEAAPPAPRYFCPLADVLMADRTLYLGTVMFTGNIASRVAAKIGRNVEDVAGCWPVPPFKLNFQGSRDAFCTNLQRLTERDPINPDRLKSGQSA